MEKIGVGAPSTGRKGNMMACTLTIYPINMINGQNKNRGIENPKERAGTSVQGIAEKQMEKV